jgi:hypothetical protein
MMMVIIIIINIIIIGARGSVVVMLQTGRSPVRYPMRWFLNLHNPSGRIRSGIYSASDRNEYQKHKNNNVSGE